jgi:hypothetical protein
MRPGLGGVEWVGGGVVAGSSSSSSASAVMSGGRGCAAAASLTTSAAQHHHSSTDDDSNCSTSTNGRYVDETLREAQVAEAAMLSYFRARAALSQRGGHDRRPDAAFFAEREAAALRDVEALMPR